MKKNNKINDLYTEFVYVILLLLAFLTIITLALSSFTNSQIPDLEKSLFISVAPTILVSYIVEKQHNLWVVLVQVTLNIILAIISIKLLSIVFSKIFAQNYFMYLTGEIISITALITVNKKLINHLASRFLLKTK